MSTTQQVVETVARNHGVSDRRAEIDAVVQFIEAGSSQADVEALVRHAGAGSGLAQTVARDIFSRLSIEATSGPVSAASPEPVVESTEPAFDRQRAADVVRAFIDDSGAHLRNHGGLGFQSDQVDALLVLAGLEDEPEPEPEPEALTEEPQSVLDRLVSWARGRGFAG